MEEDSGHDSGDAPTEVHVKKDAFLWKAAHDRDAFVRSLEYSETIATRITNRTLLGDPAKESGIDFSYPFMMLPYWTEDFIAPDPMHTSANEVCPQGIHYSGVVLFYVSTVYTCMIRYNACMAIVCDMWYCIANDP
jgi:hypothetical protein